MKSYLATTFILFFCTSLSFGQIAIEAELTMPIGSNENLQVSSANLGSQLTTSSDKSLSESPVSKQIGVTGLPIIYLNNSGGNLNGFNGLALYGSIGWFIKKYNVVGLRPFYGVVDSGFDNFQRLQSLGSNVYYRRYLNRNRFSFFVDANVGFGYIWYSSKFPSLNQSLNELNGTMFNYAFGPGLDYEINNGWNIELVFQYLQMENIDHPEDTTIGETIIPSIGIQKFF